jgi:hypothetical protein
MTLFSSAVLKAFISMSHKKDTGGLAFGLAINQRKSFISACNHLTISQ